MVKLPRTASVSPFESVSSSSIGLRGALSETPFVRLLVDGLRRSISGLITFDFGDGLDNHIALDRGIPVHVSLPSLGPTLSEVMIERGFLPPEKADLVEHLSRERKSTQSMVIVQTRMVDDKRLEVARTRRAEAQVVRLIGVSRGSFSFGEDTEPNRDNRFVVLRPLQLVFEGLRRAPAEVRRGLLTLSGPRRVRSAYPRASDLFQLGPDLEAAVLASPSVEELVAGGWDREVAEAAVACFHLSGMLEAHPVAPSRALPRTNSEIKTSTVPALGQAPDEAPKDDTQPSKKKAKKAKKADSRLEFPKTATGGGLIILPARAMGEQPTDSTEPPTEPVEEISYTRKISERLARYEDKSYWQILRVRPDSEPGQLERSFRFLSQKHAGDDPVERAVLGMLEEAFEVLSEASLRTRYLKKENQTDLEIEQRTKRTLVVLGEGRDDESEALMWMVRRKKPRLPLIRALEDSVNWLTTPPNARIYTPKIEQFPQNAILEPAIIAIIAQDEGLGGRAKARTRWLAAGRFQHPLVKRYAEFT